MAAELTRSGHSVSWIARAESDVADHIERGGAEVIHLTSGRGANLRDWLAIGRTLRDWVPDVVILNDTHAVPLVGSAALLCRSPKPLRLAYKHTVFPLRSKLKYRLLADKLVCVSHAARDTLIRGGLSEEHAVVIHGGCTPPTAQVCSRESVRRELGLHDENQTLVVCVGNLLRCKGHSDLLEATRQLMDSQTNVFVVIAGEGEERPRLEALIQQLDLSDNVRLLGYRADAHRLIESADLVVHPSHAEGLSLVLIQAQMLEKPIVGTVVGGTNEVLCADSEEECTCWIAEPANSVDLARQMQKALSVIKKPSQTFWRRLARTAQRTLADFDIGTNTGRLADLAAQLIKERHRKSA